MKRAATLCVLAVWLAVGGGCGEGGSNPVLYPEVRFQVQPLEGLAKFHVVSLTGADIEYTSLAGTDFYATSIFNFVLENAGPPYSGCFEEEEVGEDGAIGGAIGVRLVVTSGKTGGNTDLSCSSKGPGTKVSLMAKGGTDRCIVVPSTDRCAPNAPPLRSPNPEVRFDVCAPIPGYCTCYTYGNPFETCYTPGDPHPLGTFGIPFGGNMGDIDTTHQLQQRSAADPAVTTPSIYFLQKPQEAVSGVFRSLNGNELVARLYINGGQQSVAAGTQDVVVKKDL